MFTFNSLEGVLYIVFYCGLFVWALRASWRFYQDYRLGGDVSRARSLLGLGFAWTALVGASYHYWLRFQ